MISYSIESDKIIKMMQDFKSAQTSEIIDDLIKEDLASVEKQRMIDGVKYFKVENSYIENKNFNVINILGNEAVIPHLPNNKIKNAIYRLSVIQKISYIGNPKFKADNEEILKTIENILGEDFPDLLNDWEIGATNKGIEYLHPYIADNELNFVIFPATQIIPIYDTKFQKKLVSALRYYPYQLKIYNKVKDLYMVEIYTKDKVYYYEQGEDGKYNFKREDYHFNEENSVNGKLGLSWGLVPIIPLLNNTDKIPDLHFGKSLLDDYDLHKSLFSNELEAVREVLLHIDGYDIEGTTPEEKAKAWGELKRKIEVLKMIITNDENSKVNAINQEIPIAAKDSHLDRTRKELFDSLMALDPQLVGDGNITNVVLKARYALLNAKADIMIAKLKTSLRELLKFVSKYSELSPRTDIKKFDYKAVEIEIGKNMIINDAEIIQNLNLSHDEMSLESRVAKHPYVEDAKSELDKLKMEADAYQVQLENQLNAMQNQAQNVNAN